MFMQSFLFKATDSNQQPPRSTGLVKLYRARPGPPGSSHNGINTLGTCDVPEVTARPEYTGRMRCRVAGFRMHSETHCRAAGRHCRDGRANGFERAWNTQNMLHKRTTSKIVQPLQDCPRHVPDWQMSAMQRTLQSSP